MSVSMSVMFSVRLVRVASLLPPCDRAGASCVSAPAAAQSVRSYVQPGRRSHLQPPQLHPPHGAGPGPSDWHTGWKYLTVVTLSKLQIILRLWLSVSRLFCLSSEHQKMCYTALVLTMIFSMGEQVPYHHYGMDEALYLIYFLGITSTPAHTLGAPNNTL